MGAKGEDTKTRIIKTAKHLFKHKGYSNTTIDEICNEARVNRGNLYFYFSSKEELASAALDEAFKREFPFIERIIGNETAPVVKVERMIDGMVGYIIDRDCKGG